MLEQDIRNTDYGATATAIMYSAPFLPSFPAIAAVVSAPEWGPAVYDTVVKRWVPAAYHAGLAEEQRTREESAKGGWMPPEAGWRAEQGGAYADGGTLCKSDRVHIPVDLATTAASSPNRPWEESVVFQQCGPKTDNPCSIPGGLAATLHPANIPYTIELADGVEVPPPSIPGQQSSMGGFDRTPARINSQRYPQAVVRRGGAVLVGR